MNATSTKPLHVPAGSSAMRQERRQSGSVLAVGLLFLLLLTLLTLIATMQAKTGARLAGNTYDRYLAFQSAEAALREGEFLLNQAALPVFNGGGYYVTADGNVPGPLDLDETNSLEYSKTIDGVAEQPRYIIEQLAVTTEVGSSLLLGTEYVGDERIVYRVSALGIGRSANTRIGLQSTYRR